MTADPDRPVAPDATETPETPEAPEAPEAPDTPEEQEAPVPPETAGEAATPTASPDAGADEGSDPDGDGDLAAALAAAERSRDEYLDHLRRERAEFENYRRRATRERMDALDRGAQQLITDLLGVLDNFGFALGAAAERDAPDQLAKGVQMVHGQLLDVLHRAGLEEIDGPGSVFDPNHHEAMLQVEADEPVDEPVVVEVLRPGYRFKGRVLRPASVKVAK